MFLDSVGAEAKSILYELGGFEVSVVSLLTRDAALTRRLSIQGARSEVPEGDGTNPHFPDSGPASECGEEPGAAHPADLQAAQPTSKAEIGFQSAPRRAPRESGSFVLYSQPNT